MFFNMTKNVMSNSIFRNIDIVVLTIKFLIISWRLKATMSSLKFCLTISKKNIMRLINVRIKREFHDLLWKYKLNEIKFTFEKLRYKKIKRCKKFHELNVIYNNVFLCATRWRRWIINIMILVFFAAWKKSNIWSKFYSSIQVTCINFVKFVK